MARYALTDSGLIKVAKDISSARTVPESYEETVLVEALRTERQLTATYAALELFKTSHAYEAHKRYMAQLAD